MAGSVANDRETPEATLVVEYGVSRLGRTANLRVVLGEVMYDTEEPAAVESSTGQSIVVSSWAGRTDLVEKAIYGEDRQPLGIITAWEDDTTTATLAEPLAAAPATVVLRAELMGMPGLPAYRMARGGRRWELRFGTGAAQGAALAQQVLGAAHYAAASAVLDEMGVTYDPLALQDAIQSCGVNLDGVLADQGNRIEEQRWAGEHPWLTVVGDAPFPGA